LKQPHLKDLKKILDRISGRQNHTISVTVIEPYDDTKHKLSFDVEIQSAIFTSVMTVTFVISNGRVNGEIDDLEFEYWFNKPNFQEEFKVDTYDFFKLSALGVDYDDFEMKFIFD